MIVVAVTEHLLKYFILKSIYVLAYLILNNNSMWWCYHIKNRETERQFIAQIHTQPGFEPSSLASEFNHYNILPYNRSARYVQGDILVSFPGKKKEPF